MGSVHLSHRRLRLRLLFAPVFAHTGRALLSVLAIALGVALGYAVQLINQVAVTEFSQALQALSGEADLEISGPRGGFDESLYPVVARMPGVAVASPVLELDVRAAGKREALKLVGVDVFRAARVQPQLAAGETLDALDYLRPDSVFLSQAAADWLQVAVGDAFPVQVGLGEVKLRMAGILRGEGLRQRLGVMDIAGAQWRLGRLGVINRIDVRARPGADVDALAARLREVLPAGVIVERLESSFERSASMSRAYRVNLNVLALVALFTGGLLVFSTQALSVVQRRAQSALLRVLGMTRRQLLAVLLAEALAIGAIGASLGVALGHFAAELVTRYLGADLGSGQFRGLQPVISADPLGLALFALLGVATALAGSLVPALEAARAPAAQALKAGDEQSVFERLRPALPGVLVVMLGAALTQGPPVKGLPIFGYFAIACLLVGTVMLMPRFAALCFGAMPAARNVPSRLALAQLAGAPGQAMVSLAAIVASVSLMVSMAIMVTSFRHSLAEWLEKLLPADLYVRTGLQNEAGFLSPADEERIRAIPGVRRAAFLRRELLLLSAGQPRVLLLAREIDRNAAQDTLPLVGPSVDAKAGDAPPVWVSEAVSDLYGYSTGAVVRLPIAGRPEAFTVAGVWRDYARQQGSIVMEREVYARMTGDRNANDAALWLEPGADAATVEAAIRSRVEGGANLEMAQPGEIREASLRVFDRTFAVTYGLEAVAVVIGLFGLSSSFGALVLARRREFGMLRHVGMTRRQVGAMLAAEGAFVSALGLATGLALGWLISLVLIHVVNRQSFHWSMDLHLPWGTLASFAAAMLGLAVLTALASGRRAMSDEAVRAVREDW